MNSSGRIRRIKDKMLPRASYPPFCSGVKEDLAFCLLGSLLGAAMAYLFFKSPGATGLALPGAWMGLRVGRRKLAQKRQETMETELRDYLLSVIAYLQVGYALENAMTGAEKELRSMHGDKSIMGREAIRMSRELRLKTPPEKLWRSLADRSGLEDCVQVANVFMIAKRQGGDYLPVLKACVRMMDARGSVRREIQAMMAGQRLEYYIMCLVPAGMLIYLNLGSPDMTRYLYEGAGPLIMAGMLLAYGLAVFWGDRILGKSYEKR